MSDKDIELKKFNYANTMLEIWGLIVFDRYMNFAGRQEPPVGEYLLGYVEARIYFI